MAKEDDLKRFQTEAESAANLQHPNIVAVHEVGQHEGQSYFSMDYIDGKNLSEVIRDRPLSANQAAIYVRAIAKAIHHAHEQGTLHRDVKSSNVLIDQNDHIKITDFGLAMRVEGESELTQTGQILGTPSFMSPEQAQGKRGLIGPASDIYSIGAVLYELLTGRAPFRSDSAVETLRQVILTEPVSPRLLTPTVPKDLETICLKCLEKEPHRRYGTALLLADDLESFINGEPITARPINRIERTWRWCHRKPLVASLLTTTFLLLTAVTGGVTWGYYREAKLRQDAEISQEEAETAQGELKMTLSDLRESFTRIEEEQSRNAVLMESIDDLETRKAILDQQMTSGQSELAATFVRIAGLMVQTGRPLEAKRYLEMCRETDRNWAWRYWFRQCDPRVMDLDKKQILAMKKGKLIVRISGVSIEFTSLSLSEIPESVDDDRLLDAVTSALTTSLDRRPSGTIKHISNVASEAAGIHAIAVHFEAYRKTGEETVVMIIDSVTKQIERAFPWSGHGQIDLAFSEDGRWLAASDTEKGVIWDVSQDWQGHGIGSHHIRVHAITFSPKGKYLATAPAFVKKGGDGIKLWNVETGDLEWRIDLNSDFKNYGLAFDPSGRFLAAIGDETTVWDVIDQKQVAILPRSGKAVVFLDEGIHIAGTGGGKTWIWNLQTNQSVAELHVNGTGIAINSTRTRLAVARSTAKRVSVWEIGSWRNVLEFATSASANRLKFSPDGRHLAVAEGRRRPEKELAEVFDAKTGQLIHSLRTNGGEYVFDIDYSPDGGLIATANHEVVYIWDARTGNQVLRLHVPDLKTLRRSRSGTAMRRAQVRHRSYSVAFDPTGRFLAVGWDRRGESGDNIIVWDTAIGSESICVTWNHRQQPEPSDP